MARRHGSDCGQEFVRFVSDGDRLCYAAAVMKPLISFVSVLSFVAIASAATAADEKTWHVKAIHPEGRLIDVKALDKSGKVFAVKAFQEEGNNHLLDVK